MKNRAQNRNSLKPVTLNSQELQSRPTTASFFFEEPKSRQTLRRLTTEPCSLKNSFQKSKFSRYTAKHSPNFLVKNKERQASCTEKIQNCSPKQFLMGEMCDWNNHKQPEVKLKKTNQKLGSILRALRSDLAQKLQIKQRKSLAQVAILGTKIL